MAYKAANLVFKFHRRFRLLIGINSRVWLRKSSLFRVVYSNVTMHSWVITTSAPFTNRCYDIRSYLEKLHYEIASVLLLVLALYAVYLQRKFFSLVSCCHNINVIKFKFVMVSCFKVDMVQKFTVSSVSRVFLTHFSPLFPVFFNPFSPKPKDWFLYKLQRWAEVG